MYFDHGTTAHQNLKKKHKKKSMQGLLDSHTKMMPSIMSKVQQT